MKSRRKDHVMTVHANCNRDEVGGSFEAPTMRRARSLEQASGPVASAQRRVDNGHNRPSEDLPDASELWESYWATGSLTTRNELIEMHMYLVDAVVRRLPFDVRRYWGEEELRSFGTFGLIDAVERRQAALASLSFATYANSRIRGAIYDELRALDWLPRTARRRAIDFKVAEDALRGTLKRNPGFGEVLDAMHVAAPSRSRATATAVNRSQMVSLDDRLSEDNEASKLTLLASPDDVESELFSRLDGFDLSAALANLPDRQRAILGYRYRDRLTLQQVGDLIGVSYSRICQIEQATLRDLRGVLEVAEVA